MIHPAKPDRSIFPLTGSLSELSLPVRRRVLLFCMLLALPLAYLVGSTSNLKFFHMADVPSYEALAVGQPVMWPFASRQLSPLLVRKLVEFTHLSLHAAFISEGVVWLAVFFTAAMVLVLRTGAPRWMVPAIAGMLLWARAFNYLGMPDLLFSTLLCLFLVLLERRRYWLAALMMFPLTLTREATLLVVFCLVIAGWKRMTWLQDALAVCSMLAGSAVVKRMAVNALPNNEHISPTLYLVAKMPWNLLRSVFGIKLWSNLYTLDCQYPTHVTPFHVGPLTSLGYCGFDPQEPLWALATATGAFGLLPLLLIAIWRTKRGATVAGDGTGDASSVLVRFCLVYGGISFVLAPVLGTWFPRLFDYAWPLFVVGVPLLLGRGGNFRSERAAAMFLVLHLVASWSVKLDLFPGLWITLACYVAGGVLLRRTWRWRELPGVPSEGLAAGSGQAATMV